VPIIRRNNCVYATVGTCYSVWMTVWNATLHTRQSSTWNNKYKVSHKHSCFSRWWAHSRLKHVEIDKYTNNKLCAKLVLFTMLHFTYRYTSEKVREPRFYQISCSTKYSTCTFKFCMTVIVLWWCVLNKYWMTVVPSTDNASKHVLWI